MATFETVLFDLDGTLINSVQLILDSYHHTLRVHGIPARSDDDWLRGVGTPLRVQFAEWEDGSGMIDRLVATYRDYNLTHHDSMVTAYDGVAAMLQAVRAAGRRTALVTSKNRQGAIRGLNLTGMAPYIEVLVCADDVENPKPHPEPVHKALALLDADPGRAIFFGDSVHDIHSGHAAGVKTGAVLWGPFGREYLEPSKPDYWIAHPRDIPALIAN